MDFTSRLAPELGFAGLIVKAILLSVAGIAVLIACIALRRWHRGRYFRRLSERTFVLRGQWNDIVAGKVPAKAWRLKPLDCEMVEGMLLEGLELAALLEELPLVGVILHQLEAMQTIALQLPHLSDARLVRIAEILMRDPRDDRTLAQLCKVTGAGKRSVERLFQQEIGMTFGKWRQQLRLMQGMRLLAEGAKVTHAALESGYSTPSAFTSMFRKALGITPSSYFR